MLRKLITEFVGTFLFVVSIALAVAHAGALAPLAIGAALMCVVYAGGHVSGGHFNPAVTLAIFLRSADRNVTEAVAYAGVQIAGAAAAAVVGHALTGTWFVAAPASSATLTQILLVETIFTFFLVFVVLRTATDDAVEGNSFYGLAIGFTVVVGAFVGGPISGGAFNPAVGLGPVVSALRGGEVGHVWVYAVGPCAGAILASFVYNLTELPERSR